MAVICVICFSRCNPEEGFGLGEPLCLIVFEGQLVSCRSHQHTLLVDVDHLLQAFPEALHVAYFPVADGLVVSCLDGIRVGRKPGAEAVELPDGGEIGLLHALGLLHFASFPVGVEGQLKKIVGGVRPQRLVCGGRGTLLRRIFPLGPRVG